MFLFKLNIDCTTVMANNRDLPVFYFYNVTYIIHLQHKHTSMLQSECIQVIFMLLALIDVNLFIHYTTATTSV